jgi:hypothetical protein
MEIEIHPEAVKELREATFYYQEQQARAASWSW